MKLVTCFLALLTIPALTMAQKTTIVDSSLQGYRTIIAGKQYKRDGFHNFLWGKHYRKEWTTQVNIPVIRLDTIDGGLTPMEQGGGRQTKTLRLQNAKGRQYVLRSIDKNYKGALPEIYAGTFVEDILNDQVSTAHPYAAIAIPMMIEAAGVYHTNPQIVFVPSSPNLGVYAYNFANTLCLFEERPDDDQTDAPNFGYSKNVVGTEKMLEKIREKNDHVVDQNAFVRARLFDMFLGDWGRHEDQWRWAEFEEAGKTIYRPIPRDRDQTWTLFDGLMLKTATSLADLDYLRSFDEKIKEVSIYNYPARNLDRRLTNEITRQTWIDIAKDLQQRLTDSVIEASIHQLPPEVFSISGPTIIYKLKNRRAHLVTYATDYYEFISKDVDIPGSEKSEFFKIQRINHDVTSILIYDLDKEGKPKDTAFYSREFNKDETKEIRIYGLKGNDVYHLEGHPNDIKMKLIGGIEKDSVIIDNSSKHTVYYDNPGNAVNGKIKSKIDSDTSINKYVYNSFKYDKQGFVYLPFYTNRRGVFWNFGYKYVKQQWRKEPFGWRQILKGYYSITNKSFGADYIGTFNELIGKWNLLFSAHYDQKLSNHFFGIGNETKNDSARAYYKTFTNETGGVIDFNRRLGRYVEFGFRGIYEMVKVLSDDEPTYFSKNLPENDKTLYSSKHFGGGEVYFNVQKENDPIVPTKGFIVGATANYIQNLKDKNKNIDRYTGLVGFYIPFSKSISWASRSGIATVTGDPEFYQLPTLGGAALLRGYTRQRFYGKTAAYFNNDLRWIFNVHTPLFNGKMGLIAFYDDGRVWVPGEDSNKWHPGYGGGLMIVPFNLGAATVFYSLSKEAAVIQLRFARFF